MSEMLILSMDVLLLNVCLCGAMRSTSMCTSLNTLCHVLVPRLCHSGQTHRFRRCSSAAAGAFEYPKKYFRKGNKEELYFTLIYFNYSKDYLQHPLKYLEAIYNHVKVLAMLVSQAPDGHNEPSEFALCLGCLRGQDLMCCEAIFFYCLPGHQSCLAYALQMGWATWKISAAMKNIS